MWLWLLSCWSSDSKFHYFQVSLWLDNNLRFFSFFTWLMVEVHLWWTQTKKQILILHLLSAGMQPLSKSVGVVITWCVEPWLPLYDGKGGFKSSSLTLRWIKRIENLRQKIKAQQTSWLRIALGNLLALPLLIMSVLFLLLVLALTGCP